MTSKKQAERMNDQIQNPVAKAAFAGILAYFGSWAELAAFLAAMYSLFLIGEFIFKKGITIYNWRKNRKATNNVEKA
uniref:Holin n=1 Tax=Pectobacterium phage Koroua TaxID=3158138 RepID=A0AB39ABM9_9CAUD